MYGPRSSDEPSENRPLAAPRAPTCARSGKSRMGSRTRMRDATGRSTARPAHPLFRPLQPSVRWKAKPAIDRCLPSPSGPLSEGVRCLPSPRALSPLSASESTIKVEKGAEHFDACSLDRVARARQQSFTESEARKTPRRLAKKDESPTGNPDGAFCEPNCASVSTGFFWLRRLDSNQRHGG